MPAVQSARDVLPADDGFFSEPRGDQSIPTAACAVLSPGLHRFSRRARDPGRTQLRDLGNERLHRDRFGEWELDGPLSSLIAAELIFESQERPRCGKQRMVFFEPGELQQRLFVKLEPRHAIADALLCLGDGGSNRGALLSSFARPASGCAAMHSSTDLGALCFMPRRSGPSEAPRSDTTRLRILGGGDRIVAMERTNSILLIVLVVLGATAVGLQAADAPNAKYSVRTLALPDHGQGNITMDYITYDPKTGYVWVPAINIGSVDVVNTGKGSVREISGFATKELEVNGRKRAQGPSGVSIGNGVVYIGDRADSSVCAVDEKTLARRNCGHIDSTPDGVVYVAPTKEVWVTAPGDNSVRILDSHTLAQKEKLTFEGRP